jgi:hypothetical protein
VKGLGRGLFESTLVDRKTVRSWRSAARVIRSTEERIRFCCSSRATGGTIGAERREISENGVAPQATLLADGTLVVLTGRPNIFILIDRTVLG